MNFRFGKVSKVPATVYFLSILMTSFVIGVGVAGWVRKGSLSAVTSVLKTPALLALPPAAIFATQVGKFHSQQSGLQVCWDRL